MSATDGDDRAVVAGTLENGDTVTLLTWRSLTLINIIALGAPLAISIAGVLIGWWWLVVLAAAVLGYGLWTTYLSTKVTITVAPDAIDIFGARYPTERYGPFSFKRAEEGAGIDDEPGWIEIWLNDNRDGAHVPVCQMSGQFDGEAIVKLLNRKLTADISTQAPQRP